jgi:L-threonylcarbamoyladenylate synthase
MQALTNVWVDENLVQTLKDDGVAVMPTDTLYGIVGRAESKVVVNRIYSIRRRAGEKPCIILISDFMDLSKFGILLSEPQKEFLQKLESVPTSIILDCDNEAFAYLHRGTKTLAFRLPTNPNLRELLKKTGPLIAPSANPEGLPPSKDLNEAKNYFGDSVDVYVDGGTITGKASRIIRLHPDGAVSIIRE